MKLAITVCATQEHAFALITQAARVQSNIRTVNNPASGVIILVGDECAELKAAVEEYKMLLPGWEVQLYPILGSSYKRAANHEEAMMVLAQMRAFAFSRAQALNVDCVWSLDSDVLPPHNALRCMLDMLRFDNGYYSVATCPYPNYGFIGGRGERNNPIYPAVYPDEHEIPKALTEKRDRVSNEKKEGWEKELVEIEKEIADGMEGFPPVGTVFARNAKNGWKRRGWLEDAYPALGKGAVVPVDWAGFGCNLITAEALAAINWDGYGGEGTEDLWVCYRRWQQAGLRLCAIPHVLCDHVKVNPGNREERLIFHTYHETDGPMIGHTRTEVRPFYELQRGEPKQKNHSGRILPVIKALDKPTKKELLAKAFEIGMLQVPGEISSAYDFFTEQKPKRILEIGTDAGGLLYLLLSLRVELAVSVDLEKAKFGTGISFEWRNKAFDKAFPDRIKWVTGDSTTPEIIAQAGVAGSPFDLIIIDGDHTKAKEDYTGYKQFLKPGGWFFFHDIKDTPAHRIAGVTVMDFWKQLMLEVPVLANTKEFLDSGTDWGGIGLLQAPT